MAQSMMRQKLPRFSSLRTPGAIVLAWVTVFHTTASADDWPQWRGPNHNGISAETRWRDRWDPNGPPILWKAKVGTGFSSFAAASGRVYTMGHLENQDAVFCFDAATGKEIWRHSYFADLGDKYFDGGTTGTPTVDGGRVFTFSRWGDLFCLDAASGKVIWSRNIQKDAHARVPTWGFSGSPIVHENLLMLNAGEAGMALNKGTGQTIWQSANKEGVTRRRFRGGMTANGLPWSARVRLISRLSRRPAGSNGGCVGSLSTVSTRPIQSLPPTVSSFQPGTEKGERFSSPAPVLSRRCFGRPEPCALKGTPPSCWAAIFSG